MQLVCGGTVEPKAEMALASNQGHCLLSPPLQGISLGQQGQRDPCSWGSEAPAVHSLS